MTTVYVTKWALTRGILVWETADPVTGKAHDWRGLGICARGGQEGSLTGDALYGSEWHVTRETAVNQARLMRVRKIASLERALAKMKVLRFKAEE